MSASLLLGERLPPVRTVWSISGSHVIMTGRDVDGPLPTRRDLRLAPARTRIRNRQQGGCAHRDVVRRRARHSGRPDSGPPTTRRRRSTPYRAYMSGALSSPIFVGAFFLAFALSFVRPRRRLSFAPTVDFGRRRAQKLSRSAVAP